MPSQEPLQELIRRAQQHDPAAFDQLVDRFSGPLYGLFCRLAGSTHDAEDLLQELFLRVVRMVDSYKHDGRFEAWLYRIAINLVRDHLRRLRRQPAFGNLSPALL
jgi:RNA polymerase sigma-70 factor (ECF subfamily)